jgi:hypothetical protein
MITDSILKPNPTSSRIINYNAGLNLSKIRHMIENFNVLEFYELRLMKEREPITRKLTILAIRCVLQKADDTIVPNCKSKSKEKR